MATDLDTLSRDGVAALRRGDARAARRAFEAIEGAGRGTHQLRLLLAQACTMERDAGAAHGWLDRVLAEENTNLYALVMKGDLLAYAGDRRAAVSWYQAALKQAPRAGQLPPDLLATLKRAEGAVAESGRHFQETLDRALAADGHGGAGSRFAEALDILAGRAEPQLSQPTSFYYPGLPAAAFFPRDAFPWVATLEAAAPAIRAELDAVMAGGEGLVPYVAGDENRPARRHVLLGDRQWSAFHLWRGGAPVPGNGDRCPETMRLLAEMPIPVIRGRSPMALFSVLAPGTHIPPHHGMLNTRLICHLPLIVPDGCRLRVGNETREVRAGEAMIFDDTIEHEAWNDGGETRVVLLFEVWRPELSEAERAALTTLFNAIAHVGGLAEEA